MAVTLTKEFWTNFVLFVVACVALGLSIWAFATPCKKDGFGSACAPNGPDWNDNLISLDKYNSNPTLYKNQCSNAHPGEGCELGKPPYYLPQDSMQCCLGLPCQ